MSLKNINKLSKFVPLKTKGKKQGKTFNLIAFGGIKLNA
jgi:hypothetical protein